MTGGGTSRRAETLRPATFGERGMSIPFNTPGLRLARFRTIDGREECVIRNFANPRSVYIVPWSALGRTFTLSMHDRLLHQEISGTEVKEPIRLRGLILATARTGMAGIAAAERAERLLAADRAGEVMAHYQLLGHLLAEHGLAAAGLTAPVDMAKRIHIAMRDAACAMGMTPKQVMASLERSATIVAATGFPAAAGSGRYRRLTDRLRRFTVEMAQIIQMLGDTEAGIAARHTADAASRARIHAERRLAQSDRMVEQHFRRLMKNAHGEHEKHAGIASRVSWLIDEWEMLIDRWDGTAGLGIAAQARAIAEIGELLPILPLSEDGGTRNTAHDPQTQRRVQRRWVRSNADWRTGQVDGPDPP